MTQTFKCFRAEYSVTVFCNPPKLKNRETLRPQTTQGVWQPSQFRLLLAAASPPKRAGEAGFFCGFKLRKLVLLLHPSQNMAKSEGENQKRLEKN